MMIHSAKSSVDYRDVTIDYSEALSRLHALTRDVTRAAQTHPDHRNFELLDQQLQTLDRSVRAGWQL